MKLIASFILIMLAAGSCKERYDPPIHTPVTGYLVVEGGINSGLGPTLLTLSRTSQLDSNQLTYESGAQVSLQGEDSSLHPLTASGPGQYAASDLNLNTAIRYRLKILTALGKSYISEFVPVVVNPPIDSISWVREDGGVRLYANTHNPLNNTRYYQWEFNETWEFHSAYYSSLKYQEITNGGNSTFSVVYRDSSTFSPDISIYKCWQSQASTNILLGSSAKLSQDIIHLPIAFVPQGSQKMSVLYSINVRQWAWTKEGYQFLDAMRKNTETTGSVFDPQPSELFGNIHSVENPSETVIGYFHVSPVQEQRIFIHNTDLADWGYLQDCNAIKILNISDSIASYGIGLIPTTPAEISPFGGHIISFFASSFRCVDCTLTGTNIKPPYWP